MAVSTCSPCLLVMFLLPALHPCFSLLISDAEKDSLQKLQWSQARPLVFCCSPPVTLPRGQRSQRFALGILHPYKPGRGPAGQTPAVELCSPSPVQGSSSLPDSPLMPTATLGADSGSRRHPGSPAYCFQALILHLIRWVMLQYKRAGKAWQSLRVEKQPAESARATLCAGSSSKSQSSFQTQPP